MLLQQQYLADYEKFLTLKNYSTATLKCYLSAVRHFWDWSALQVQQDPTFDKKKAAFGYLSERMKTKRYTTVNAEYSGLKMFFVHVLEREWNTEKLPRPRKEKPLPVILSKQEVEALINHAGSFRNQVMLALIYATGLRLGEVVRLRLVDINSGNMTIHVHNGKGAKDRVLPLPQDLLPLLREYFLQSRPVEYLFNGEFDASGPQPLHARTIQKIVADARTKAGIRRQASVHTLRHCYATHFYQAGSDGLALQIMLGHKNFKTTTRYIHLSGDHYRSLYNPASDVCKLLNSKHVAHKQLQNLPNNPQDTPPSTPPTAPPNIP